MTNTKNLKPIRTESEAREKGKKGGIKSGEARRARKTLREELLTLLSTGDTQEKLSLAILQQALEGDVKAFTTIRDTIGEKPVTTIETSTSPPLILDVDDYERLKNVIPSGIPVIVDNI